MASNRYNCPECFLPLNEHLACPGGHRFDREQGMPVLITEAFGKILYPFLAGFKQFRTDQHQRITDPSTYPKLPYVPENVAGISWKARRYDLENILPQIITGQKQRILEIGSWNGWLAYHLTKMGHVVTATSYFTDEFDGLLARKHYPVQWEIVHMNIEDVHRILPFRYDVIIVNWGISYVSDLTGYSKNLINMLTEKGVILYTGIPFYRDPSERLRDFNAYDEHIREKYGTSFFFKPTKGFLQKGDKKALEKLRFRFRLYPFRLSLLKSFFNSRRSRMYYAVFKW